MSSGHHRHFTAPLFLDAQEPTLLLSLPKNQRGHQGPWGLRLIASSAHKGPVCAAGVSGCLMPCKPAVLHLCQAWVSDTRWGIAVLRKAGNHPLSVGVAIWKVVVGLLSLKTTGNSKAIHITLPLLIEGGLRDSTIPRANPRHRGHTA